jgi:cytochrome c oxidase subunit 2
MTRERWWIAGIVALTAVILVGGTLLIGWFFFARDGESAARPFRGRGGSLFGIFGDDYASNGERIYFTGSSATGLTITAQMPGMHRMGSGMMACASCHGEDGRGGTVRMMMSTFEAPDIRYERLTSLEHGDAEAADEGEAHEEHPPYTDETIKRAITQGLDPAGEPLEWMMPRWDMTDQQLDDLLAYLKTLH